jgi:hypothetical protein
MLMRYAAVTLLLVVLTASAVRAQSPAPARAGENVPPVSSMLDGAVTYTLPAGWRISMYMNRSTHGSAEIHHTEKGPPSGLFLSAHFVPEEKTVDNVGDDTFGNSLRKVNGGTVLSDKSDGEGWRTVVWTQVTRGQPNLWLEHFGVVNRKFVDLTASLSLDSGDVKGMKQVVEDFNAVCESLKIDGQGSFENKVSSDIITEQLKVGAKN